jgi:hypothetical protein
MHNKMVQFLEHSSKEIRLIAVNTFVHLSPIDAKFYGWVVRIGTSFTIIIREICPKLTIRVLKFSSIFRSK